MDEFKGNQLWQIIEILSGIEDEYTLIKETAHQLSRIFPGAEFQYYKISYSRIQHRDQKNTVAITIKNMLNPEATNQPLSDYPDLLDCIESKKPVIMESAPDKAVIFMYPLNSEKGIRNIFRAKLPGITDYSEPVLKNFFNTLIHIYKLITSNERDFLTGLYNRRAFSRVMHGLEKPDNQGKEWLHDYLVILDIDFFKKINDRFGHMIGDEVLILFSRILRENVRAQDTVFRTGGEEFVILTRQMTQNNAFHACERLRNTIQNTVFPQVNKVTISMGFAIIDYPVDTYYVLKKADRALYYAKDHGRNKVYSYEWLVLQHRISEVTQIPEVMDIW